MPLSWDELTLGALFVQTWCLFICLSCTWLGGSQRKIAPLQKNEKIETKAKALIASVWKYIIICLPACISSWKLEEGGMLLCMCESRAVASVYTTNWFCINQPNHKGIVSPDPSRIFFLVLKIKSVLFESTNASERKPEQKFWCDFWTVFRISHIVSSKKSKMEFIFIFLFHKASKKF